MIGIVVGGRRGSLDRGTSIIRSFGCQRCYLQCERFRRSQALQLTSVHFVVMVSAVKPVLVCILQARSGRNGEGVAVAVMMMMMMTAMVIDCLL